MASLESLLGDPMVEAAAAFIVIPAILVVLLVLVVYALRLILAPAAEVAGTESRKEARFEAGNPEKGAAKARVSMQYMGYMIIFLAVEPALVLLALALAAPRELTGQLGLLYLAILVLYTPFMVYAVKEAKRLDRWILE